MAYLALLIGIVLTLPLSSTLANSDKNVERLWLFIGVGLFLYPLIPQFGIEVIGDKYWPGYAKGVEINIVDLCIFSYLLSQRGKRLAHKPPFTIYLKIYFAMACLSLLISGSTTTGLFYIAQLLRLYMFYTGIHRMVQNDRNLQKFMDGMAIGMTCTLILVIFQRFGYGWVQPPGPFAHQNSLGLVNNLVLITLATPLIAYRGSKLRTSGAFSALIVPAVIASRATAMLGLGGIMLSYAFSMMRGRSSRKMSVALLGIVMAAVLIPVAIMSFSSRFKDVAWSVTNEIEEYDEREAFKAGAKLMLQDHPLGVGANNFVLIANTDGYYEAGKVAPSLTSRSGHVHNIYYLTACELGYQGLAALILMFVMPLITGYKAAWKLRGSVDSEYIGGCCVALTICYLHSFYEWIIISSEPMYFYVAVFATMAGLITRNRQTLALGAKERKLQMANMPARAPALGTAARPPLRF